MIEESNQEKEEEVEKDTLRIGEVHPSAHDALSYIRKIMVNVPLYLKIREAICSAALSGNRLGDICLGTMNRIESNQPISDRYILGLAWIMRGMQSPPRAVKAKSTNKKTKKSKKKKTLKSKRK